MLLHRHSAILWCAFGLARSNSRGVGLFEKPCFVPDCILKSFSAGTYHAGSAVVKKWSFSYRDLPAVIPIKVIWRPVKLSPWSKRCKLRARLEPEDVIKRSLNKYYPFRRLLDDYSTARFPNKPNIYYAYSSFFNYKTTAKTIALLWDLFALNNSPFYRVAYVETFFFPNFPSKIRKNEPISWRHGYFSKFWVGTQSGIARLNWKKKTLWCSGNRKNLSA